MAQRDVIFVINTGSTSTKLSFFSFGSSISLVSGHNDEKDSSGKITVENIPIESELSKGIVKEIETTGIPGSGGYDNFIEEYRYRKDKVLQFLKERLKSKGLELKIVAARGGILKPVPGGVYRVNEKMVKDLINCVYGKHSSNMSAPIAFDIAKEYGVEAFIAYPVVTDEMDGIARFTGFPEIKRKSLFHALNQKSVARIVSKKLSKDYRKISIVVCHMGGGISVGLHVNGRVVDVNNALDGEGPFSVERAGTLPAGDLVRFIFNNKLQMEDVLGKITGKSGIFAYLKTKDARIIERVIFGEDEIEGISPEYALFVVDSWAYRIAKEICSLSAYTSGKLDAIVITGGLAFFKYLVKKIVQRVSFLSNNVFVIPGENEMKALAEYSYLAYIGEEEILEYGS